MADPHPEHPAEDAAALAEDLRMLISKVRRRLRDHAGGGDFTPSQIAVLVRLEKEQTATTSDLARAEGMRPQSMGAIVAGLEQLGLIVGSPDPDDGRRTLLSLTADCRIHLRESRAARQDWLSRTIDARLTPAERREVAAALALLRRLTDDEPQQGLAR